MKKTVCPLRIVSARMIIDSKTFLKTGHFPLCTSEFHILYLIIKVLKWEMVLASDAESYIWEKAKKKREIVLCLSQQWKMRTVENLIYPSVPLARWPVFFSFAQRNKNSQTLPKALDNITDAESWVKAFFVNRGAGSFVFFFCFASTNFPPPSLIFFSPGKSSRDHDERKNQEKDWRSVDVVTKMNAEKLEIEGFSRVFSP